MGIGSIYKELTFDGENSGDYGIYITGAGTFNAPQRDVELVTIPGRNGSFALDHGRFENIEVTYPAGLYGSDETDFADKIAEARAWLCSKSGYVRLQDEYNPNEYRLAVYKSGLEVSPALLKAGEFDLVFECMPQRFLTSGETAQTIASSGDTLTNPTLFNARPLLMATGYGGFTINDHRIEIISQPIGRFLMRSPFNASQNADSAFFPVPLGYSRLNTGDRVDVFPGTIRAQIQGTASEPYNFSESGAVFKPPTFTGNTITIETNLFTYRYGTAKSASATFTIPIDYQDSSIVRDIDFTLGMSVTADGALTFTISTSATVPDAVQIISISLPAFFGVSSKSALGDPVYIDLDIGEAYLIEGGEMVGVNSAVNIGAELPELHPGANEITFENTITNLDIVPRWWTV